MEFYVDSKNGTDHNGENRKSKPYRTISKVMSVLPKVFDDVYIYLNSGEYDAITESELKENYKGKITIIGRGKLTKLIQRNGYFSNNYYLSAKYTNPEFKLVIKNLVYHFEENQSTNYNCVNFNLSFYNVAITGMKDLSNWTAVYVNYRPNIILFDTCVRVDYCPCFLRTTDGEIIVRNSSGYFTSGYGTSDSSWDKGNNTLGDPPKDYNNIFYSRHELLLRHTKTGKIYTIKEGSFS